MSGKPNTRRKIAATLVSQLPVGVSLWALRAQAEGRPLTALALIVLYESVLGISLFLKRVWQEELEKDFRRACAEGVRTIASSAISGLKNFAPGFRRCYLRQLVREYGLFNDRGLGLINANRLDLSAVFVELRIASSSNPVRVNHDPIGQSELTGHKPIWEFLRRWRTNGVGAAIVGAPGSGKTTLLLHVLLVYATNRQWRRFMRARIPIVIFLREHVAELCGNDRVSLSQLVEQHIRRHFPRLRCPPNWFERKLNSGRCIVLLDGLDEVADESSRKKVSRWIDDQIKDYANCQFVLTARPQGYRTAPLARANVLEVQPFDPMQVRAFVHNWYLANETVSSGYRHGADVLERAKKEADDLLRRLSVAPAIYALTVTPLLLTMIAMVHRYHGALPGSRVQLYSEICQVLLERWRAAKGISESLRGDQKVTILQGLAAHMMEREIREIPVQDAMIVIRPRLDRVGFPADRQATFLSDLQESSGLLVERESGRWSFAHLTFQEYLTASFWLAEQEVERRWDELVARPWWHETLRLYAAQGDGSAVLRACLDNGGTDALCLAWDCLAESRELELEVRRAGEARLYAALEQGDTEDGCQAAQALLSRRLSERFCPLDDHVQLDSSPVSAAEYQLFIRELRPHGVWVEPGHWLSSCFRNGQGRDPVKGSRLVDARRFCEWVTQQAGGAWKYRLPQKSELRAFRSEYPRGCTLWVEGTDGPDWYEYDSAAQVEMGTAILNAGRGLNAGILCNDVMEGVRKTVERGFSGHSPEIASARFLELARDVRNVPGSDNVRDVVRDFDLTVDRASEVARERALISAIGKKLAATLAKDCGLVSNPSEQFLRAFVLKVAVAHSRDLFFARVAAFDALFARARDVTHGVNLAKLLDGAYVRSERKAHELVVAEALQADAADRVARDRALATARTIDRKSAQDLSRSVDHEMALGLARTLAGELANSDIDKSLASGNYSFAKTQLGDLVAKTTKPTAQEARRLYLLENAISSLTTEDVLRVEVAQRRFWASVLAIGAAHSYSELPREDLLWWSAALKEKQIRELWQSLQQYLWLSALRLEGKLPAFECIWLARER